MNFTASPFEKCFFEDKTFYIKRDDLLDPHFSGNKARKFYHFLTHDFPHIKRVVSYGSNQSNAMYSLSVLALKKGWEFIYFCDHIPRFLKENPMGNFKYALQNGMTIIESKERYADSLKLIDEITLHVEEGGRQNEAEEGIEILAEELMADIKKYNILNPYIFLPSGTGTTALFLQKYLPFKVFTCSCVGDDSYLQKQWEMITACQDFLPTILTSKKKHHYGKLYVELYVIWKRLKEEMGIEFDLMYDPVGWNVFLENVEALEGTPIYIHQGGILGNTSMLERYARKANML
ncbi:MAG: 1-aminocyclopropane-1-carboxylate deaminase/D-cysteine desulfhydrase [Campylobacteraceae bacterium]|nr:1-aminocyclopropane-1-carboxylate deaminase/D-cysteine desulfhydrase [Campylobacteraceae bacterium]